MKTYVMLVFALFVVLPDMGDLTSDCGRTVLDECFLTNITSEETGPTVNCSTLQVSQRNSLQRNTTNEMVKREPIRGTLSHLVKSELSSSNSGKPLCFFNFYLFINVISILGKKIKNCCNARWVIIHSLIKALNRFKQARSTTEEGWKTVNIYTL